MDLVDAPARDLWMLGPEIAPLPTGPLLSVPDSPERA
jgi:hypothetical protein